MSTSSERHGQCFRGGKLETAWIGRDFLATLAERGAEFYDELVNLKSESINVPGH